MKSVYRFGGGKADGSARMKDLLGGKGANLAEMVNLGLPVPPGLTIATTVSVEYMKTGEYPSGLADEVKSGVEHVEPASVDRFGIWSLAIVIRLSQ